MESARRGSLCSESSSSACSVDADEETWSRGLIYGVSLAEQLNYLWNPEFALRFLCPSVSPYASLSLSPSPSGVATDQTHSVNNYVLERVLYKYQLITRPDNKRAAVDELMRLLPQPTNRHEKCRADLLRRIEALISKKLQLPLCTFCKNNNQLKKSEYMSHSVRDITGRVSCPILRAYKCPKCGESGDNAHTIRYCPLQF